MGNGIKDYFDYEKNRSYGLNGRAGGRITMGQISIAR